jgi:hypothetical protein
MLDSVLMRLPEVLKVSRKYYNCFGCTYDIELMTGNALVVAYLPKATAAAYVPN